MSCRNRFIVAVSRPNIGDLVTVDPELQVCLAAKCRRPLHNQPTSLRARLSLVVAGLSICISSQPAQKNLTTDVNLEFIIKTSSGADVLLLLCTARILKAR